MSLPSDILFLDLNRISLDGFFAGPNGEIDWFVYDPEVDKATHERKLKP